MAALAPVALRLLPAIGAAAAGGAGYEAIEQGYRRIKNKITDRRSRSGSRRRSRSRSRSSGRKRPDHDDRKYRRSSSSSRSRSRSSDRNFDRRRYESRRQENEHYRAVRTPRPPRHRRELGHRSDGKALDSQTDALVLRRENSSEDVPRGAFPQRPRARRTASDPRIPRPPTDPHSQRVHPAHRNQPFEPSNPGSRPEDIPQTRGFSSEAEFRLYERASRTDSEVLCRQSIHPMTPEMDKRVARRVLLERGWRPRPLPFDRSSDMLSLGRQQALENSSEELFSPAEVREQSTVGEGQQHRFMPGGSYEDYYSDHSPRRTRGSGAFLEPEERHDERRSRSHQSRRSGGRTGR
jgi:hypothetical protein